MALMQTDARCSLLCQHPSCWATNQTAERSQKVTRRGQRSPPQTTEDDSDSDEGLPTQSVVNLLGDYGADPNDRYPLDFEGRPTHDRLVRSATVPRMSRSNLSGASGINRSITEESTYCKLRVPNATPASDHRSSSGQLGVLGGRAATISGTSTTAAAAAITGPACVGRVEVQEVFDLNDLQSDWHDTFQSRKYYVWVPGRRKTDEGFKVDRQPTSLKPLRAQTAQAGPSTVPVKDVTEDMIPEQLELERETVKMIHDVWPVIKQKLQNKPSATTNSDEQSTSTNKTPRGASLQTAQDNYYGDMMNRERFTEAIIRALPSLKQDSTTVSLAHSQVLRQKKVNLLDGKLKAVKHSEPFTAKRMYLLDQQSRERTHLGRASIGSIESPVDPDRMMSPQCNRFNLNSKPLPDIKESEKKRKIPAVSLGLPEIPSGPQNRQMRPFNYSKQDLDFTLGPLVTPPRSPLRVFSPSPAGSDQSSTLHVTVPSIRSEVREDTARQLADTEGVETTESPMHAISPSHSTRVPQPPLGTPATRGTFPRGKESSLAFRESSSVTSTGQPGALSAEPSGVLGTIPESELQDDDFTTTKPKSRRSVRFAQDLLQGGSPPPGSEKSVGGTAASVSVHHPPTADDTSSATRSKKEMIRVPTAENLKQAGTPGVSPEPEPWPQVDERAFDRSPTPLDPPPSGAPTPHHPDQSVLATADDASERSGLSSMLTKSAGLVSRESSFHSEKLKLRLSDVMQAESPAPPPPSPEIKEIDEELRLVGEATAVNILEDLVETDSDYTLSAKPPSNLDDISRIHTPIYTPVGPSSSASRQQTPGTASERKESTQSLHPPSIAEICEQDSPVGDEQVVGVSETSGQLRESSDPSGNPDAANNETVEDPSSVAQEEQECDLIKAGGTQEVTPDEEKLVEDINPRLEEGDQRMVNNSTVKDTAQTDANISRNNPAAVDNSEGCPVEDAATPEPVDIKGLEPERSLGALSGKEMELIVASGADSELQKSLARLDQFDITEDALKEELKKEYEKLDSDLQKE